MEKNNEFRNYIDSLPRKEINFIKKEIMAKCCISQVVYYNYMQGRSQIPHLAKPIIEKIAKKKIFDI